MKIAKPEEILELDDGIATAADVPVIGDDGAAETLPTHAVLQDDGSVHLPLKRPVMLKFRKPGGGEVIEETHASLHLHRLTGADLNAISNTGGDKRGAIAIARAARMPAAKMLMLYDRMDGADVMAATNVISHFLETGAPTGR